MEKVTPRVIGNKQVLNNQFPGLEMMFMSLEPQLYDLDTFVTDEDIEAIVEDMVENTPDYMSLEMVSGVEEVKPGQPFDVTFVFVLGPAVQAPYEGYKTNTNVTDGIWDATLDVLLPEGLIPYGDIENGAYDADESMVTYSFEKLNHSQLRVMTQSFVVEDNGRIPDGTAYDITARMNGKVKAYCADKVYNEKDNRIEAELDEQEQEIVITTDASEEWGINYKFVEAVIPEGQEDCVDLKYTLSTGIWNPAKKSIYSDKRYYDAPGRLFFDGEIPYQVTYTVPEIFAAGKDGSLTQTDIKPVYLEISLDDDILAEEKDEDGIDISQPVLLTNYRTELAEGNTSYILDESYPIYTEYEITLRYKLTDLMVGEESKISNYVHKSKGVLHYQVVGLDADEKEAALEKNYAYFVGNGSIEIDKQITYYENGVQTNANYDKVQSSYPPVNDYYDAELNPEGWGFGLYYDQACTEVVVDRYGNPYVFAGTPGKQTMTGIPAGTYYLKEFGELENAELVSERVQRVTVIPRAIARITSKSRSLYGWLELYKVGTLLGETKALKDVTFTLYSSEDDAEQGINPIAEGKTDANGYYLFNFIDLSSSETFYLRETLSETLNKSYVVSQEIYTVEFPDANTTNRKGVIRDNQGQEIGTKANPIVNYAKEGELWAKIILHEPERTADPENPVQDNSYPASGKKFTVSGKSLTANEAGEIRATLADGVYTLKFSGTFTDAETSPDCVYWDDTNKTWGNLKNGISVSVEGTPKEPLEIHIFETERRVLLSKKDQTNQPVPGAVFRVYKVDKNKEVEVEGSPVTSDDGGWISLNADTGTYRIYEISVEGDYVMDLPAVHTFSLDSIMNGMQNNCDSLEEAIQYMLNQVTNVDLYQGMEQTGEKKDYIRNLRYERDSDGNITFPDLPGNQWPQVNGEYQLTVQVDGFFMDEKGQRIVWDEATKVSNLRLYWQDDDGTLKYAGEETTNLNGEAVFQLNQKGEYYVKQVFAEEEGSITSNDAWIEPDESNAVECGAQNGFEYSFEDGGKSYSGVEEAEEFFIAHGEITDDEKNVTLYGANYLDAFILEVNAEDISDPQKPEVIEKFSFNVYDNLSTSSRVTGVYYKTEEDGTYHRASNEILTENGRIWVVVPYRQVYKDARNRKFSLQDVESGTYIFKDYTEVELKTDKNYLLTERYYQVTLQAEKKGITLVLGAFQRTGGLYSQYVSPSNLHLFVKEGNSWTEITGRGYYYLTSIYSDKIRKPVTGYRLEEGKEYAVGVPADWKDGINRRTDFGYEYSFYDVPSRTNFTGLDPDELAEYDLLDQLQVVSNGEEFSDYYLIPIGNFTEDNYYQFNDATMRKYQISNRNDTNYPPLPKHQYMVFYHEADEPLKIQNSSYENEDARIRGSEFSLYGKEKGTDAYKPYMPDGEPYEFVYNETSQLYEGRESFSLVEFMKGFDNGLAVVQTKVGTDQDGTVYLPVDANYVSYYKRLSEQLFGLVYLSVYDHATVKVDGDQLALMHLYTGESDYLDEEYIAMFDSPERVEGYPDNNFAFSQDFMDEEDTILVFHNLPYGRKEDYPVKMKMDLPSLTSSGYYGIRLSYEDKLNVSSGRGYNEYLSSTVGLGNADSNVDKSVIMRLGGEWLDYLQLTGGKTVTLDFAKNGFRYTDELYGMGRELDLSTYQITKLNIPEPLYSDSCDEYSYAFMGMRVRNIQSTSVHRLDDPWQYMSVKVRFADGGEVILSEDQVQLLDTNPYEAEKTEIAEYTAKTGFASWGSQRSAQYNTVYPRWEGLDEGYADEYYQTLKNYYIDLEETYPDRTAISVSITYNIEKMLNEGGIPINASFAETKHAGGMALPQFDAVVRFQETEEDPASITMDLTGTYTRERPDPDSNGEIREFTVSGTDQFFMNFNVDNRIPNVTASATATWKKPEETRFSSSGNVYPDYTIKVENTVKIDDVDDDENVYFQNPVVVMKLPKDVILDEDSISFTELPEGVTPIKYGEKDYIIHTVTEEVNGIAVTQSYIIAVLRGDMREGESLNLSYQAKITDSTYIAASDAAGNAMAAVYVTSLEKMEGVAGNSLGSLFTSGYGATPGGNSEIDQILSACLGDEHAEPPYGYASGSKTIKITPKGEKLAIQPQIQGQLEKDTSIGYVTDPLSGHTFSNEGIWARFVLEKQDSMKDTILTGLIPNTAISEEGLTSDWNPIPESLTMGRVTTSSSASNETYKVYVLKNYENVQEKLNRVHANGSADAADGWELLSEKLKGQESLSLPEDTAAYVIIPNFDSSSIPLYEVNLKMQAPELESKDDGKQIAVRLEASAKLTATGMRSSTVESTIVHCVAQVKKVSISGLVWFDSDKDGLRTEDEAVVSNVPVILHVFQDGNELGSYRKQTGADGSYKFDGLPAGKSGMFSMLRGGEDTLTYQIEFVKPELAAYTGKSEETDLTVANDSNVDTSGKTVRFEVKSHMENLDAGIIGRRTVQVMKKDDLGNVLPGAKFQLTASGYSSQVLTTGEDGKILFDNENIPVDQSLRLREIEAPDGYQISPEYKVGITIEPLIQNGKIDFYDFVSKTFHVVNQVGRTLTVKKSNLSVLDSERSTRNFQFELKIDGKPYTGNYTYYKTSSSAGEVLAMKNGLFEMPGNARIVVDGLIPGKTTYSVKEIHVPEGYTPSYDGKQEGVMGNANIETVVTNKDIMGYVVITKTAPSTVDPDTEFAFSVKVKEPDDDDYVSYVSRFNYLPVKTLADGSTKTMSISSSTQILLKAGEQLKLPVPLGTSYQVEEITDGKYTPTYETPAEGTVTEARDYIVRVHNQPNRFPLYLTKTIQVPEGVPVNHEQEFAFTVKLNGVSYGGNYTLETAAGETESRKAVDGVVTLKAEEKITIPGLLEGTSYEIQETNIPEGYAPKDGPDRKGVVSGETTVSYVNTVSGNDKIYLSKELLLTDEFKKQHPEIVDQEFTFQLTTSSSPTSTWGKTSNYAYVVYNAEGKVRTGSTDEDGCLTLKDGETAVIEKKSLTTTYYIWEKKAEDFSLAQVLLDGEVYRSTTTTGTGYEKYGVKVGTVKEGDPARQAVFQNRYTGENGEEFTFEIGKEMSGEVQADKNLTTAASKKSFSFSIKADGIPNWTEISYVKIDRQGNATSKEVNYFTSSGMSISLYPGEKAVFSGEYFYLGKEITVTESSNSDYPLEGVCYNGNDAETNASWTGTMDQRENVLTFTNGVKKMKFTVKKNVTNYSALPQEQKDTSFTVQLTGYSSSYYPSYYVPKTYELIGADGVSLGQKPIDVNTSGHTGTFTLKHNETAVIEGYGSGTYGYTVKEVNMPQDFQQVSNSTITAKADSRIVIDNIYTKVRQLKLVKTMNSLKVPEGLTEVNFTVFMDEAKTKPFTGSYYRLEDGKWKEYTTKNGVVAVGINDTNGTIVMTNAENAYFEEDVPEGFQPVITGPDAGKVMTDFGFVVTYTIENVTTSGDVVIEKHIKDGIQEDYHFFKVEPDANILERLEGVSSYSVPSKLGLESSVKSNSYMYLEEDHALYLAVQGESSVRLKSLLPGESVKVTEIDLDTFAEAAAAANSYLSKEYYKEYYAPKLSYELESEETRVQTGVSVAGKETILSYTNVAKPLEEIPNSLIISKTIEKGDENDFHFFSVKLDGTAVSRYDAGTELEELLGVVNWNNKAIESTTDGINGKDVYLYAPEKNQILVVLSGNAKIAFTKLEADTEYTVTEIQRDDWRTAMGLRYDYQYPNLFAQKYMYKLDENMEQTQTGKLDPEKAVTVSYLNHGIDWEQVPGGLIISKQLEMGDPDDFHFFRVMLPEHESIADIASIYEKIKTKHENNKILSNDYSVYACYPGMETAWDQTDMEAPAFLMFILSGDSRVLISGLPEGTAYTVEEITMRQWAKYLTNFQSPISDEKLDQLLPGLQEYLPQSHPYTLASSSNAQGTINKENSPMATFVNSADDMVRLTVHKTLEGAELTEGAYTFLLTETAEEGKGYKDSQVNDAEGNVEFELTFKEPGIYNYTIQEQIPDGDDPLMEYDTHILKVKVTVTKDEEGKMNCKAEYDGSQEFVNRRIAPLPETGSLMITKEVTGDGGDTDQSFAFTLTLKNANGDPLSGEFAATRNGVSIGSVTSGDKIFLKHGDQVEISDLPAGTHYSVVEESAGYDASWMNADGVIQTECITAAFINHKDADEPDVPDQPDDPDEPDVPDIPDLPVDPDEPDVPDIPDLPVNPDEPDAPNEPDLPNIPVGGGSGSGSGSSSGSHGGHSTRPDTSTVTVVPDLPTSLAGLETTPSGQAIFAEDVPLAFLPSEPFSMPDTGDDSKPIEVVFGGLSLLAIFGILAKKRKKKSNGTS